MSVLVSSNVRRYLHFFQSFSCSVNCMLYCFCFIYVHLFFFNIGATFCRHFVYDVFAVVYKPKVICILLVNYIVSCYMYVVFVLFCTVIMVKKVFNGC